MDKSLAAVLLILLLILIGVSVYDQYEQIHVAVLKHNGNLTNNTTTPQLIPSIPYQFINIIFLVVAVVVIIGLFIYIFRKIID